MKKYLHTLLTSHPGFSIFLIVYSLFGLINLAQLPIVWTDEIQHLDPVFNYLKNHHFSSKIWPNPGAEKHFLSYPPLITNLHLLFLSILPNTVFFIRLPFFLASVLSFVLLYRFLIQNNPGSSTSGLWLIVLLFALDKSVFEITRSMRIEPWIWLMTIAGISVIFTPKWPYRNLFLSALAGLLTIAHLYMWPLALLWATIALTSKKNSNTWYQSRWLQAALFFLPCIITYTILDAPISEVFHQLLFQSNKHGAIESNTIQYSKFLWGKFWPYYLEQPLTPWLFLLGFAIAIIHIAKYQHPSKWILMSYLSVIIPQAFLLTPHIRYFGTHWLLTLLILVHFLPIQRLKENTLPWIKSILPIKKWLFLVKFCSISYLFLFCSGYLLRHAIAMYQREDRKPQIAYNFLDKHFPSTTKSEKQIVIFGEPIVDYYAMHRSDIAFGLSHYPEHWTYNPDSTKYFVFHKAKPSQLPFLKILDSTGNSENSLPQFLQRLGRAHTYKNTYLYQIQSLTQWDSFFSKEVMEEINGK